MIGRRKRHSFRGLKPSFAAVALALVVSFSAAAAIPQAERQALLDLYEHAGGPSWDRNDGWGGPEGSEGTWYGVVTDPENSTVIALLLGDNGLAGKLPEALGELLNLRELDLSANRLEGPVPAGVTGLRSFVRLDLSGTPLAGSSEVSEVVVSGSASTSPSAEAALGDGPVINGHQFKLRVENGVVLQCRLTLFGARFQGACEVRIDGQPAPKSIFESEGEVHAKGGAKLKKMLPKGQVLLLTARNPDGQVSPAYPFTRP